MIRAALIALALIAGCAPRNEGVFGQFPQEPIASVGILPWGNRVLFGQTVDPAHYGEVLSAIDARVGGSLPRTSFEIYSYPLVAAGGAHSFRTRDGGLIVLSWWIDRAGVWEFGDLEWEVSHARDGTKDDGTSWR